jgi:hypothetical protein
LGLSVIASEAVAPDTVLLTIGTDFAAAGELRCSDKATVAVALAAVAVALRLADSTSVDCPAQALRLYS